MLPEVAVGARLLCCFLLSSVSVFLGVLLPFFAGFYLDHGAVCC